MLWNQAYDPLGNWILSTIAAALPILILLGTLAFLKIKTHRAALFGLAAALAVAIGVFGMPAGKAAAAAVFGTAYGMFPIGWIILNVLFLYDLVEKKGLFKFLGESLTGITQDRRLQVLLIAFSFGSFFEGAAGFGAPVAVTAAILIGLGFSPLIASGLSLIANTISVSFGSLGTPIVALAGVTGLDVRMLSAMIGRQSAFFALLIPFWLIWAFAGFRGMIEIWPALLAAGVSFALPLFLLAEYHGPWLACIGAGAVSLTVLLGFLHIWRPKRIWKIEGRTGTEPAGANSSAAIRLDGKTLYRAWMPWIVLTGTVFLWGIPRIKIFLDGLIRFKLSVPGLDGLVNRMPPLVSQPSAMPAVLDFTFLSFTGTGILVAAFLSALFTGYKPFEAAAIWIKTLKRVRFPLLTVVAMLALGFIMRFGGLDAAMGLAFAKAGALYPFFGTLLGWLGVATTGSVTSSNVLFGGLQKVSAIRIGLSPTLMAAANSTGGVMGKMIAAQSIIVSSTATRWYGHEGEILRYVFFHSLALASLIGLMVFLQAYVPPFTKLVIQ